MNIVEIVQRNLGYPQIKKIDPNTSEPKDKEGNFGAGSLPQAAIPLTVLGLLNHLDASKLGPNDIDFDSHNGLQRIFPGKNAEVISMVASYSGNSKVHTKHEMNSILKESVRIIKEMDKNDPRPVHEFVVNHWTNTILYLPGSLHAGLLLGDNQIDDDTTKMEGPVSNVLHSIEKKFM